MLTTKILGFTEEKPTKSRGINWCGQPIKDGEDYYGKIDVGDTLEDASQTIADGLVTRRRRKRGTMSPEKRKAFGDRMRAYWQRKRATDTISVVSPSVEKAD